ncbi:hypothetical protein ONZ45_g18575 [Pleurotus djamor]|nr:hypothetical protein ONZ45_g18575 [Pleurotus djamor]
MSTPMPQQQQPQRQQSLDDDLFDESAYGLAYDHHDPSDAVLDKFNAMHIADRSDPVPRAASSMSYHHQPQRPPRHAQTLPPALHPQNAPPGYDNQWADAPQNPYLSPETSYDSFSYQHQTHQSPPFQQQHHYQPQAWNANADPLYLAASDVLGMAQYRFRPPIRHNTHIRRALRTAWNPLPRNLATTRPPFEVWTLVTQK